MIKAIYNLFALLILLVTLSGCEDPDDLFLSFDELDFETNYAYDAQSGEITIDYVLVEAESKKTYRLVSSDGPILASWQGAEVELERVSRGMLHGVVPLQGVEIGELQITTELLASVIEEITVLTIADLPSLLPGADQDNESLQIAWSPATVFEANSEYLSNHTVEVMLRDISCGDIQMDFSTEQATLPANSNYASENSILTSVPYQSVVELLRQSNTELSGQCALSLSIATQQELSDRPLGSSSANEPITINTRKGNSPERPGRFANNEDAIHSFTFYSRSTTFSIDL